LKNISDSILCLKYTVPVSPLDVFVIFKFNIYLHLWYGILTCGKQNYLHFYLLLLPVTYRCTESRQHRLLTEPEFLAEMFTKIHEIVLQNVSDLLFFIRNFSIVHIERLKRSI